MRVAAKCWWSWIQNVHLGNRISSDKLKRIHIWGTKRNAYDIQDLKSRWINGVQVFIKFSFNIAERFLLTAWVSVWTRTRNTNTGVFIIDLEISFTVEELKPPITKQLYLYLAVLQWKHFRKISLGHSNFATDHWSSVNYGADLPHMYRVSVQILQTQQDSCELKSCLLTSCFRNTRCCSWIDFEPITQTPGNIQLFDSNIILMEL